MLAIQLCSVVFDVTALCLKQDSLTRGVAVFVDRSRRTTHKCYNLYSLVEMLMTRDGHRCQSQILVKKRGFCPS